MTQALLAESLDPRRPTGVELAKMGWPPLSAIHGEE